MTTGLWILVVVGWLIVGGITVQQHATHHVDTSREYDVFALLLGPLAPPVLMLASWIRWRR